MTIQLDAIMAGELFIILVVMGWQLYLTWQLGQALTWLVKAMPGINMLEKALMQPQPVVQVPQWPGQANSLENLMGAFQAGAGPASSVDIPKDVAGMTAGTFGGPEVSEDEVFAAIARTRAARMGEE